jgi:hypothetical protein
LRSGRQDPRHNNCKTATNGLVSDNESTPGRRRELDRPVYPIRDVKPAVCAEGSEIVRRDGFCFARALEDEELREDSDRLEEDGEGPDDLYDGVGVVEEERKDE